MIILVSLLRAITICITNLIENQEIVVNEGECINIEGESIQQGVFL